MRVADSSTHIAPPVARMPERAVESRPVPHRRIRKRLAALGLLLAFILVTAFGIYRFRKPTVVYLTSRVDRSDIDSTVVTTGNLNAVTTVQVGSQVSGNIKALYADFNTKVKQGQVVALIDPAPFQAALDQAKGALDSAKAAAQTAEASLAKSQSDLASAIAYIASQKANLVKAQSAVALAKTEADRRLLLVKADATSQEDYDTAKANYDQSLAGVDAAKAAVTAAEASADSANKGVEVATAQLDQAKATVQEDSAEFAQAKLNLSHTRILAPVDGTVESRNMDIGQTVAASFQAPVIFLIAQDLAKMQVDTNVGEADVAAIRVDQTATFTVDAFPGQIFEGKVWQIRQAPINVQNVITYDVVISVSNDDLKLFPGMTANVAIFTGHASNALRIPKAALRFHPRTTLNSKSPRSSAAPPSPGSTSTQIIYALDKRGQLTPVRVRLGIADGSYAQVLEGPLHDGDPVVVGIAGPPAASPAPSSTGGKRLGF